MTKHLRGAMLAGTLALAWCLVVHRQRTSDKRDLALWVAFGENGAAPVMKGWFFPGMIDGYEFLYPPVQARMIARAETAEIAVAPRG